MNTNSRDLRGLILGIVLSSVLLLSSCIFPNPPEVTNRPETTESPEIIEAPSFTPLVAGPQIVWGGVLGGGDQTPEGLLDAPRTFIYQVLLDSGEEINITYTSYPPSPASETNPGPQLTFYNGEISAGDYLVAQGTYDADTRTLNVVLESDFIETFLERP